jgi:hypothetical protein
MEKVEEVNVKWFFPEMLANHLEDGTFQNERIIGSDHADAFYTIPARLAATGDARIHYVIGNEEKCLELFAQGGGGVKCCGKEGERGRYGPIRRPSRGRPP